MDKLILETRVKKYKQYRLKIKKEYSAFIKSVNNKDEVKSVEKQIKRIEPSLLISHDKSKIFVDFSSSWTNDDGYINEAKTLLMSLKKTKFIELLNQTENLQDYFETEPSFDEGGVPSLNWLSDDPKYPELIEIREWLTMVSDNSERIKKSLSEKIFNFKDTLYELSDQDNISKLLPSKIEKIQVKVNKKNKKIYYFLFTLLSLTILLAIIFLILYLVIL